MLYTSGVNWMTMEQMKGAFRGVDLNQSGGLHLTELAQAIAATDHDCKQLLKGTIPPDEFLERVLAASETVSITPRRRKYVNH
ncbi:hypothetical protein Pmar_PMAR002736 [Perkinsus marinus ATCC 50983]|uniref:EF-hand domain-containing protein n=1 Tax=Perkinsus marinus (strain ATCC 50983 / TXsc) TaxID=423536 RepID=C5K5S4_PERM5|nr:hypothetical protein Pmar_PMAR002736 [Perkinsus marinus ATCC 50983]EER20169.1 hypothetical protein Pmar_PMAR002736 [Perkinsus marinus ATCC 50983]|eukprot:XP_002788373.1 hypothetical protein Pmar_PMAR002736 [Perkinsus marinus ATCC 50983]